LKNNHQELYPFTLKEIGIMVIEKLIISSPERAYLEVLLEVPQKTTFEHADQLMQGINNIFS
jgi:hypothetical protein